MALPSKRPGCPLFGSLVLGTQKSELLADLRMRVEVLADGEVHVHLCIYVCDPMRVFFSCQAV